MHFYGLQSFLTAPLAKASAPNSLVKTSQGLCLDQVFSMLFAWVEEGDAMLPGRAANALHDPGNHVDLEPSEHAGRRNLRRKGQKSDAR